MSCTKTGRYGSEKAALEAIERLWAAIREGRAEFRMYTPTGAVWCYAHGCWHTTSRDLKPKRKGKRGTHKGMRTNDRRFRSKR